LFSARFNAVWRHYRYTVLNQPAAVPLLAATTWHVAPPLDLWAMQLGCDPLIGEHDFTSFCRKPKLVAGQPPRSMTRRVMEATWRRYRYTVLNQPVPVPLLAATTWHVPSPLNLWAMQLACDPLIGEHDFASFCRRPKVAEGEAPKSLTRRVLEADWTTIDSDYGELLRFEIRANAFCHQMVRSIVGTLVDVGRGRRRAGDMRAILAARSRQAASAPAPPHALCLWDVGY